jgi:hypothetical protein
MNNCEKPYKLTCHKLQKTNLDIYLLCVDEININHIHYLLSHQFVKTFYNKIYNTFIIFFSMLLK